LRESAIIPDIPGELGGLRGTPPPQPSSPAGIAGVRRIAVGSHAFVREHALRRPEAPEIALLMLLRPVGSVCESRGILSFSDPPQHR